MNEIYNESNQESNNYCDIDIKENQKDFKQSSEHSSINTLATNSSQHLTTSKKEHSHSSPFTSTENTLNNSHSTLNSGEYNSKHSKTASNHSKMAQIHENEIDSHITKQAFANASGSIPNSVQSSENSLNSKTPTEKRSTDNITKNNGDKVFDLNDKHLSITLSCHSSDSNNSINKEEAENKKASSKDKKGSGKEKSEKGKKDEKEDKGDKDDKGNKKFGFKHFKSTISKTFSKASFRKFSTSHKNKINGTTTGCITEQPQDLGFTTKEEQEEFNNFVNTLNMKKSKQRPSLSKFKIILIWIWILYKYI